jgi:hypothetical protein
MSAEWPLYFAVLTPDQHYRLAMQHLYSGNTRLAPSTRDMEAAIHHLRVIPADSPMHREAVELIPLIELKMDRLQDFPAIEQARFLSCMAGTKLATAVWQEQMARSRPCPGLLTREGKCFVGVCATMGLTTVHH